MTDLDPFEHDAMHIDRLMWGDDKPGEMQVDLCADCITLDANGWDERERPLPDPVPMSLLEGYLIGPHETDHICEGHFSWQPCDGCGNRLGGNRYCYIATPKPV